MAFRTLAQLMGLTTPVPASTTQPAGHPDAECRFSPFGESATAENVNRPHYALGENTDYLKSVVTRDIALPVIAPLASFTGSQIDIDPSGGAAGDINYTGQLYMGESGWPGAGWTTQERIDQIFQILDESYQEVSVDGVEVKVTGFTGGNVLGDGFVSTLTGLTLNKTLPTGNYRIGYCEHSDLENVPPWFLTFAGIRGLEEVSGELKEHKARFDIGELTSFTGNTVSVDATGGSYPAADISMSPAGFIYLGGSSYSGGGTEEAGFLFQILDENYNPVVVDGEVVKVDSTFPTLGNGFYDGVAAVALLNLNKTVPTGNYRVVFTRNDNVAELADDAIVKGMSRYAHEHPNYEGFTAVLTDGTNSTGGDYNGPNAIDNITGVGKPFGGTYALRPGRYTWNTATTVGTTKSVYGETYQWGVTATTDLTSMEIPSGASADFNISGTYKNLILSSKAASYRYSLRNIVLENVQIQSGCSKIDGPITWRGGGCTGSLSGNSPTAAHTISVDDASGVPDGIIEDCEFGPPPTGGIEQAVLYINSMGSSGMPGTKGLTFRNCSFDASSSDGCDALYLNSPNAAHIIFDSCQFTGSDGGYAINTNGSAADNYEFRNCVFYSNYSRCIYISGNVKFVGCTFMAGSILTPTAAWDQPFRFGGGCQLIDCRFKVQDNAIVTNPASVSNPVFEFLTSGLGDVGLMRNVSIELGSDTSYWHGFTPVLITGPASVATSRPTIVENLTVYQRGYGPQYDRSTNGEMGFAAVLELEGADGASDTKSASLRARNIFVTGIRASGVTDNGSVVVARGCVLEDLTLEGSFASSGAGYVGSGAGLVKLISDVVLINANICPKYAIPCDHSYLIEVGESSQVKGMLLGVLPTTYTSAIIDIGGVQVVVSGVYAEQGDFAFNSTLPFIEASGTATQAVVHNNYFQAGTHTGSGALINIPTGNYVRVTNNTLKVNKNPGAAVNTPGDHNLVDGNIFHFTVVAVITNTGTGSITGSNVVAA